MDPVIHYALRTAVSLLFLPAVLHKVTAFRVFQQTLGTYDVVPAAFVPVAAVLIVAAELGVILLGSPEASGLAALLLLAYAGVIGLNLARGRDRIDCGCVGVAGRAGLSWWLVARNLVCAAAALAVLAPPNGRETGWIDYFSVAAATTVLATFYLSIDGLIANATALRRLREAA